MVMLVESVGMRGVENYPSGLLGGQRGSQAISEAAG